MGPRAKFVVALLLLLVVLAVCISPAVDLEPTALKSVRAANLLFAALALVVLDGGLNRVMRFVDAATGFCRVMATAESILELNCTHLC